MVTPWGNKGKEIMKGTMTGARRRGRPRTAWMDNIKTWTVLPVEESSRMREDRDKWSTSIVWPILGSRTAELWREEQNVQTPEQCKAEWRTHRFLTWRWTTSRLFNPAINISKEFTWKRCWSWVHFSLWLNVHCQKIASSTATFKDHYAQLTEVGQKCRLL